MSVVTEGELTTLRGEVHPHVRVAGTGPPLVFLHGAMGLTWDPFLDALAEDYTVYAPEHPGTSEGEPDAIKSVDNIWELTLHYYDLLDGLGLDSPIVVGHSFGGMVAAEIAATNPRRVSQLVLISPVGLWREDAPVAQFMTMSLDEVGEIAFADPTGPVARSMLELPEDPEAMGEAIIKLTWAQGCTGKFMWPLPDKGLRKRLYRVTAPTLIVWGEQDRLAPPVYAQEFADHIADSRIARFDDAAHLPHLERREEVTAAVKEFLRGAV